MPRTQPPLYLHEEIMLLALRDEAGTVVTGSMYAYALGGAILAELLLHGRISVEESKKRLVNLVSDQPVGEPVIDECLDKIADAKRRANLQSWVSRFANMKNLHHRIAQGLSDRGILRADEKTVLLIFKRKVYPEINPQPERRLIERLRKAIFGDGVSIDPRTVILISLASGASLLSIPFAKSDLKRRKKRIEQIVNGEMTGKATKEAVEAAQAAVMVACVLPSVTATVIMSH
ncbi:MAG: GPP34 family phosphoprotein [Phycisphaerales bacterium]|nr:GPP34 family phosphoprotein [Phycisphaerales bacterium]